MTMMYHNEAREIIEGMRDTAVTDCGNLKSRIVTLKDEYSVDPWEETAKQIQRLEQRLERRAREVKALALAVTMFEEVSPVGVIGPGTRVTIVKTSHLDLLGLVGTVRLITPSGNYEVVVDNEIVVLAPEQVGRA